MISNEEEREMEYFAIEICQRNYLWTFKSNTFLLHILWHEIKIFRSRMTGCVTKNIGFECSNSFFGIFRWQNIPFLVLPHWKSSNIVIEWPNIIIFLWMKQKKMQTYESMWEIQEEWYIFIVIDIHLHIIIDTSL